MRELNSKGLELFRPSGKIILFIVDGKHDETEINAMLHTYCPELKKKYKPMFLAMDENDITSDMRTTAKNVIGKLTDQLIEWRKKGHQYLIVPSDIARIIHVIDTDGAFIPRESVVQANVAKIFYTDSEIRTKNKERTVHRNREKTAIVERLLNTSNIDNIPYSVWFVSCNMDHLLFNTRNPSPLEKRLNADKFRENCTPEYLFQTLFVPGIGAETYSESWAFIMKDYNSLQRHCNINLLLDELKSLE